MHFVITTVAIKHVQEKEYEMNRFLAPFDIILNDSESVYFFVFLLIFKLYQLYYLFKWLLKLEKIEIYAIFNSIKNYISEWEEIEN